MWYYVKTLEYPVNLKSSDLKMAKAFNNPIWWS